MKKYEVGEHAADLELRVWGRDLEEVFINAARGMLDYAAPAAAPDSQLRKEIILEATSLEELFVSWLNEVLFWLEVEEIRFQRFTIRELTESRISAVLEGGTVDQSQDPAGTEIKAATYHDLYVREDPRGWEAHVIFDL